jgi:TrmH family RNA methyltransferase
VFELAAGVLERVASTQTPQPVLAEVRIRCAEVPARASLVLVADRIADPGNLGTILRSAEAAGFDAVVPTVGTVDPFNPKVVRASAGALFHVPVTAEVEPAALAALGLSLVGTSAHQGVPYTEADLCRPVVLVVGSEAHGVGDDVPVGGWITIPHAGRAESLNVAMAATLVCFEARRQRGTGFRAEPPAP